MPIPMPRLFVAVDLPETIRRELARLQPAAQQGVRLTRTEQMHLTLHFLGNADLTATKAALAGVCASAFPLVLRDLGTFGSPRREIVLWIGIEPNAGLRRLHAAIAEALQPIGYQPELRPFAPHITLARCKSAAGREAVNAFLTQPAPQLPAIDVLEIALYSSAMTKAGSVYRREQTVGLLTDRRGRPR